MNLRYLPNLITLLRIVLVVPFIVWLLEDKYLAALIVFVIAGLSDALDGFLAKQFGWVTRIGGYLDPLADKTLLIAAFVTLSVLGQVPVWLTVAVILRDLIILAGASYYHFRIQRLTAEPRWLSKLNTFAQIVLMIAVMAHPVVIELPSMALHWGFVAVLATTVSSGLDYVWVWSCRAVCRESKAD